VPEPARPPRKTLSDAARAFLDAPRFAVVATTDPDGRPLQAVVWYQLRGDEIVFSSAAHRRWPANLARDPRAAIMVADEYRYVELRGPVEVDDDNERGQQVIAMLANMYEKDPARIPEMLAMYRTHHRVTFTMRPDSILEHLD
jgi:PPOX class probable F420-dependent enzyme